MRQVVVPVISGACIGAIAVWLLKGGLGPVDSIVDPPARASGSYLTIATLDRESLESRMASLAQAPSSWQRDLEMEAVLARLADLEPALAARLALALNLEPRFIVASYQFWAETGREAALAGLSEIADPGMRTHVALSLLDILGDDERAAGRIADALPGAEVMDFRIGRIARLAAADATGAMLDAQAIDDPGRRAEAIAAIAGVVVQRDPRKALAQLSVLSPESQLALEAAIFGEWARLDPAGFLTHAETGTVDSDAIGNGFRWLVTADPFAAFEFANTLTGSVGRSLQLMAISEMAAIDPDGALARIDEIPAGRHKEAMLTSIAVRLARDDPSKALAWVRQLEPPSDAITNSVIRTIVQSDVGRAVELLFDAPPGTDRADIAQADGAIGGRNGEVRAFADGLLGQSAPELEGALPTFVMSWMSNDRSAALDWVLANAAVLDRDIHLQIARSLASADPASAAAFVDRLPLNVQSDWITEVAGHFAARDRDGAVAWIARYQGSPGYDPAYREIVLEVAQSGDTQSAANLLARASAAVQTGAAGRVGRQWAAQDPRAAARWAAEVSSPPARVNAIDGVVSSWARTDFAAARRFTLDLREGAARDRALLALVTQLASQGDYDPGLLDEFSTDLEREQSMGILIPMLAPHDPGTAWDLLDREITNAGQRQQIEGRMAERGIER